MNWRKRPMRQNAELGRKIAKEIVLYASEKKADVIVCARRLFPEPLEPTTATSSPSLTATDRPEITGSQLCLLVFPLYWRKETESSSISSIFFLFVQLIFFHTLLSLTGQPLLLFSICAHFPDPEADEELYLLFQTAQP